MDFSKENCQDYLDIGSHITWKKIKDTEDILFGKDNLEVLKILEKQL